MTSETDQIVTLTPQAGASAILAVDAMGGDHAPGVIIAGLDIAAERHPKAIFHVFGDAALIEPLVRAARRLAGRVVVHGTSEIIADDLKPTAALRLRDASMRRAIDAVASGEAAGIISAGNTGAMLALAKIVIKTMAGIDRPAMAAIGPSAKGDVVMLDIGANMVCDARNLVEFAVMGEMFARTVLGLPKPTIGLLNVGSEEMKGDETLKRAAEALRASPIGSQFHGFVEGHDIAGGTLELVLTDGFTGNVALKSKGRCGWSAICSGGSLPRALPPNSPICWPSPASTGCASGSIRGATTGRCCSGSTASSSNRTAAPMPRASPMRSMLRWT